MSVVQYREKEHRSRVYAPHGSTEPLEKEVRRLAQLGCHQIEFSQDRASGEKDQWSVYAKRWVKR